MLNTLNWKNRVQIGNLPYGAMVDYALRNDGPLVLIANDNRDMAAMSALFGFYTDRTVHELPAWDNRAYDRLSPNPAIEATRASTLAALASGRVDILLTTRNAAMQKLPPRNSFANVSLDLRLGAILDIDGLHNFARYAGYSHVSTVRGAGEYAVRGGIVDIFPAGHVAPIRADLFGDQIDSLREFDPDSQRSAASVERVTLAPSGELILTEDSISRFRDGYRAMVGVPKRDDPFYEAISTGIRPQGVEQFLPLFYPMLDRLADYLPRNAKVFVRSGVAEAVAARFDDISTRYNTKTTAAPLPEAHYLDGEAFIKQFDEHRVNYCHFGAIPTGANAIDAGYAPARDFAAERQDQSGALFRELIAHINHEARTRPVVVVANSAGSAARLQNLLDEYEMGRPPIREMRSDIEDGLNIAVVPVEHGFANKDISVLAEADILGARLGRKRKSRKSAENVLAEASSLSVGDYVVHNDHGIGRFVGVQTVTAGGAAHEMLLVEYAEKDRLYVPVENIDVLSPYTEEAPRLDRLGGTQFAERKARAKKDLFKIADGLIKLAAERNLRRAPEMRAEERAYNSFASGFAFTETDDQMLAIEETLDDLASGKPMDRLVCGDVGFGKTEVAMRAAFAAAQAGFQVALIAPTTLLSRQHTRNFRERFAGTGIKVEQLSRFVTASNAKLRKSALERGEIDIVIGTHALLAKDIKFADLGLLIIDEEQHFGVKHKEKIKELRADVHVLTLSATPIPRTLQLALSGVRELSLIATPPVDRLAVRTYVAPFDEQTVRDALYQEKLRGGQSFYVVPRISDLPEIEEFLQRTSPDLRVITAHGQLPSTELDKRVNDFYDGKADVLLATTIVESGLDIPTANTLIVHRADMFGLSQLYQIRGRVGRSKLRAYAYLTTKKGAPLNPAAEKRLRILATLDTLGSGFNLASHDLDMRGAGNLLGEEQSGQIREIGFALYQSMLKEAIAKMRKGDIDAFDDSRDFSPSIKLGVAVMIPEDYVPDLDTRLSLYRRIARLRKRTEIEDFTAEMIDRFGPMPSEMETLFQVVRIKAFARAAGVESLDAGAGGATIRFHRNQFANPKGLLEFISNQHGRIKVKDTRIIVLREWEDEATRIKGAFKLVADLAKIAREPEPAK